MSMDGIVLGLMRAFEFREPASAWSHLLGLMLAVPATAYLWSRSRGSTARRVSLMIYGLTLIACYAGSTLYHGVGATGEDLMPYRRLDMIGIYLLIAGSYTPLAWGLLKGRWRWGTLVVVWLVAGVSAGLLAAAYRFPPQVSTGIYLALGWGCVACYFEIAAVVPRRELTLLVAGGVSYSVGAILNLLHWPILCPGTFEAHELFHLFVLAGSAFHYAFILRVVVPAPGRPVAALA